MGWISEYLLSITAAAIICVMAKQLLGKESISGKMVNMIAGIFMLITVLSPLLNRSLGDLGEYLEDFYISGDEIALSAAAKANSEMVQIIKQQSEAYILEEAIRMELNLCVEVNVSNTEPPVPVQVTLTGNAAPYKRTALSDYIINHFGLPEESVKWN